MFLIPLFAFDTGDNYLSRIGLYGKESYFKQKVYSEHDLKSFYQLKEPNTIIDADNYDLHLLNACVFYATNKLRESKGLNPLQFSPPLRDAAVVHTYQMIEKNFFNHFNNLNPALRSPEQRMKLFGVKETAMAENIDYNYIPVNGKITYLQVAEEIVNDFYHSPPHRKNMMGREFTHLGCATIFEKHGKQGVRYFKATQDFSANY